MPKRIVGLVGRGEGPRIFVGHEATKLHAEVRGLPPGDSVQVYVMEDMDHVAYSFNENGDHPLDLGHSVVFRYNGSGLPICAVKVA